MTQSIDSKLKEASLIEVECIITTQGKPAERRR